MNHLKTVNRLAVISFLLFLIPELLLAEGKGESHFISNSKRFTTTPVTYTTVYLKNSLKQAFRFPFSWGAGIEGFIYSQHYTTKQLYLQNEKITAYSDSLEQDITAGENQIMIKPEIWVLPFLNLYSLFGYTEGNVTPDIIAKSITVKIPFQDTSYEVTIDTSVVVNQPMKYNGPVYGFGLTASYAYENVFVELDYNYSVVYPKDMEGNLVSHRLTPKAGYLINTTNSKNNGAVWLGASWLDNSQILTGVVDVREFAGDLADYIGETADYVATLTPVRKWNMVVGGSWKFNNHYNVALEAGIIGRKKISLGFLYNF